MLSFSFSFFFFIVTLHLSIHLPEEHNRKKEKFLKNPFLSNFYHKTNLKQVIAQNSSHCFVNFPVFFCFVFFTRNKDWNKFLAKLHVNLQTNDLSEKTLCWKGKWRLLQTALEALWLQSISLNNHWIFFSSRCKTVNRLFNFVCFIGQNYSNPCCFRFHWMAKLLT